MREKNIKTGILFLVVILLVASVFAAEKNDTKKESKIKEVPKIKMQNYTRGLFDNAIKNKKPVIIYFTAAWCPPCKMMKEKVFTNKEVIKLSEKFVFLVVDLTDEKNKTNSELADAFGIDGIPTMYFYNIKGKGIPKESFSGYTSADDLIKKFKNVLKTPKPSK